MNEIQSLLKDLLELSKKIYKPMAAISKNGYFNVLNDIVDEVSLKGNQ